MSIKRPFPPSGVKASRSGFALIITLAMVVLISVGVVAFILSVQQNGQISHNAVGAQEAEVYSRAASQSIVASLQKEMAVGSGVTSLISPAETAPVIMPLNNNAVMIPSRSVSASIPTTYSRDPNSTYAQYVNLVKQSLPQPIYTLTSPAVTGPLCPASTVSTATASVDGRTLDATYWALPQLVSTATTAPLVPNWIYTSRDGTNPTTFNPTMAQATVAGSGNLNPSFILGRYAYNVYDVGGLLNANVAGYGTGTVTAPIVATGGPTPLPQQVVPSYKGSLLCADLSGLTLNNTLSVNNASAASISDWQSKLPAWRAQGNWVTSAGSPSTGFAYLLSGGELSGWLNEVFGAFDYNLTANPPTAAALTGVADELVNNHFTSRQDLINWVTNQWGVVDNTSVKWILPYLTQFSYDTDAPTFSPDPNRPRDTYSASGGGNDAMGAAGGSDDAINPAFTSILDGNGNPLVKQRFPLSALSLVSPYYPGHEPPASLASQILYDFGLYWVPNQGWVYSDWETGGVGQSTVIKTLANVPNSRSPNFFELLKAAITAGSLGKQYGNTYDGFTAGQGNSNQVGATVYSSIDCQVIQIGANIISQAAAHYFPTDIQFCYNGSTGPSSHFYGDKDLPYLYRTRLEQYPIAQAPGMVDPSLGTAAQLDVAMLQVELWNPHAPNRITPPPNVNYPQAFRVVPYMASGYTQINNVSSGVNSSGTPKWGSSMQYTYNPLAAPGDYSSMGGPICTSPIVGYVGMSRTSPTCYIQVPALSPAGNPVGTPDLRSFREPCPLVARNLPSDALVAFPTLANPTLGLQTIAAPSSAPVVPPTAIDAGGNAYASVALPSSFPGGNTPVPQMYSITASPLRAYGFVLGFFCVGPSPDLLTTPPVLTMTAPLSLYLQYEGQDGLWHTYDVIDSAVAPGSPNLPAAVTSIQVKVTDIGTRFDPRTNRWGLIWDNRHGFNQSTAANYADNMGGMGPSPGVAGGDNFIVGITGTPSLQFHGSEDALGGSGSLSGGGMVGINTENAVPGNQAHATPSGATAPGWFGSYIPGNAGFVGFTGTDYHYPLYTGYVQTNEATGSASYSATAAGSQPSSMLGSDLWVDSASTCYADPDGVIRLADGGNADSTGDGLPELMINPTSSTPDGTSGFTTLATQLPPSAITYASSFDNRPVVLDRPFQSVAELGYVFRGEPWRSLDFSSPQSGDAALLDVFSAYGPDPWSYAGHSYNPANTANAFLNTNGLVMGRVNLNTQQQPVLAAILKGTLAATPNSSRQGVSTLTSIQDAQAAAIAQALTAWTHADSTTSKTDLANQGPLRNRAELVGKYVSGNASMSFASRPLYSGFSGSPAVTAALTTIRPEAAAIKQQREAVARALADVGTTRTWNLLIDLAVQTGRLPQNATNLQTFVVSGERHVWVSVALDRVTGKVIEMQVEPVRL